MMIRILYPEVKEVTAAKILGWYHDAVENGEVKGGVDDDRIDVETAALALDHAGLITLVAGQFPIPVPRGNCGECLMEHVAIVPLEADGSCKCCESGHKR